MARWMMVGSRKDRAGNEHRRSRQYFRRGRWQTGDEDAAAATTTTAAAAAAAAAARGFRVAISRCAAPSCVSNATFIPLIH